MTDEEDMTFTDEKTKIKYVIGFSEMKQAEKRERKVILICIIGILLVMVWLSIFTYSIFHRADIFLDYWMPKLVQCGIK